MIRPEVVDARHLHQLDHSGLRIDLDLHDVGARREGEVLRIVEGRLVQPGLELLDRVVVRHVCRERDLAERLRPVRPGDGKAPVPELDIRLRSLKEVRGDPLPLGDHLLHGVVDGRAAHRQGAGAVGAHPEGDLLRVAVHDLDLVDRDAELARDDLGERRLVPLAVAVRSGVDRDAPGRVHAHLAGLVEARATPERPHDGRRGDPARLEEGRDPESPEPAARPRLGPALPEGIRSGHVERQVQRGLVVTHIVLERDRRLVGELVGTDEVPAPQLDRIDSGLPGSLVDKPLEEEGRLRSACAPERVHRHRVREHPLHLDVDRRRRVRPGKEDPVEVRRHAGGECGEIRTQVRGRRDTEPEKPALRVECQFRVAQVVASVTVRDERLRALGRPLHRTPEPLGRPGDDDLLGVVVDLGPEPSAHVGRDDPELALGDPHDEGPEEEPDQVRVLGRREEGVVSRARVVFPDRGARLDRIRDEAVVHDIERDDMLRAPERRLGRLGVAHLPVVADVSGGLLPDERRPVAGRARERRHGRELLILDIDERGRGPGRLAGLRDHRSDLVADVAHAVGREWRVRGLDHRRAVLARDEPPAGKPPDAVVRHLAPCQHRDDTGRLLGRRGVDRDDPRMRQGRAEDVHVGLSGTVDVVGELSPSGEKPVVFLAEHRRSDAVLAHAPASIASAPAKTAFTMF